MTQRGGSRSRARKAHDGGAAGVSWKHHRLREEHALQFDEPGPNTHTRRYWVSATVGITAMIAFAILSILLLLGMLFGSPQIKPIADSLFPWSLLVFAVAGVSMFIANARPRD